MRQYVACYQETLSCLLASRPLSSCSRMSKYFMGDPTCAEMWKSTLRAAIWSGAFFLAVFGLFHGGHFYHVDEELHFLVANSILDGNGGTIPAKQEAYYRGVRTGVNDFRAMGKFGLGGKFYAKAGLGQPLAAVPLAAVARLVTRVFSTSNPQAIERLIVSLFSPVIAAAGLALWLVFILGLGCGRAKAFAVVCAIGISTFYFVQAKFFMNHMLVTVLLILGLLCVQRALPNATGLMALAGFCAGWMVLTRIDCVFFAFLIPLFWLLKAWKSGEFRVRSLIWMCVMMVLPILLLGSWNYVRFGHALDLGYNITDPSQPNYDAFSSSLLPGLFGQILDLQAGLIWYAPVVPVAVAGFRKLFQRSAPAFWVVASGSLLPLVFYARFGNWAGNVSWGPRFLLPSMPLAALGLVFLGEDCRGGLRRLKPLIYAAFALGLAVQLSGVLADHNRGYWLMRDLIEESGAYAHLPYVRVLAQIRLLEERPPDLWWVSAWAQGSSGERGVVMILLAALVWLWIRSALSLRRALRAEGGA